MASGRDKAGVMRSVRRCIALLEKSERRRWLLLLPLTLAAAACEAVGTAAIFTLIQSLGAPQEEPSKAWQFVADLLGGLDRSALMIRFAILIAIFYCAKNALLLWVNYASFRAAGMAVDSLSARLLSRYLAAPYAFFFGRNSAELVRNIQHTVVASYRALLLSLVQALSETAMMIAVLAVLLMTAPLVSVAAFAGAGLIVGIILRLSYGMVTRQGKEAHVLHGKMQAHLQQSLTGVKEVKTLGREQHFVSTFAHLRSALSRVLWRQGTLESAPRLIIESCFVLSVVAVIIIYELQGRSGEVVTVLGLFAYAGFRLLPGLHRIVAQVNLIRFATHAIDEIYDDLGTLSASAEKNDVTPLPFKETLHINNLSYSYPGAAQTALQNISLSFERGTSVGIVGATGAGKSTFIDLVLGLLPASHGEILVDGQTIFGHERAWRKNVGYVPQSIFLLDDTLRRNIALGLPESEIDEERVKQAANRAQLMSLIDKLPEGFETEVGERGLKLSGGERQRVAVARALYNEPEVLLFDEATSALDNLTEREITRAISELAGERTIMVIAHRLSSVRACDQVVLLDEGRLIAQGTWDELMAQSPEFRALAEPGGSISGSRNELKERG